MASYARNGSLCTSCVSACRTSLLLVTSCGANCCPRAVKGAGQGGGRYGSHLPLLCGHFRRFMSPRKIETVSGVAVKNDDKTSRYVFIGDLDFSSKG